MEHSFRALRLVALVCRVIAWVELAAGAIASLLFIVLGALAGRAGATSPLLAKVPLVPQIAGPGSGLLAGVLTMAATLLLFLLTHAAGEVVHLGLAIEHNTRETAYYLRGEGSLPPPPSAISWEPPEADPPRG